MMMGSMLIAKKLLKEKSEGKMWRKKNQKCKLNVNFFPKKKFHFNDDERSDGSLFSYPHRAML